ncbi:hypothetical protein [Calothrix sp. PCC 7507]|nr:hypothetical protein [Calothrix sp. PCC 7507]
MTYFWRLFISVAIAFFLNFGIAVAHASPISHTQTTATEFLRLV